MDYNTLNTAVGKSIVRLDSRDASIKRELYGIKDKMFTNNTISGGYLNIDLHQQYGDVYNNLYNTLIANHRNVNSIYTTQYGDKVTSSTISIDNGRIPSAIRNNSLILVTIFMSLHSIENLYTFMHSLRSKMMEGCLLIIYDYNASVNLVPLYKIINKRKRDHYFTFDVLSESLTTCDAYEILTETVDVNTNASIYIGAKIANPNPQQILVPRPIVSTVSIEAYYKSLSSEQQRYIKSHMLS